MNMPWTLARQTARAAAKPLEAIEVALPEALGLALASGVRALAHQPTCDTSAMDGYAVSKDHLRRVLQVLGAENLVSGVAYRPGHPQLLAVLPDGRCAVGLPGNPFAALAAVVTLLQPLLGALSGHAVRPPITARLAGVQAHPHDTRLVPVTRRGSDAVPVGHDRPGSLWGAALTDALAVVPPGQEGGEVELLALTSGSAS